MSYSLFRAIVGPIQPNRPTVDEIPAPYRQLAPVVVGSPSSEPVQAETLITEQPDKNPTSNLGATNENSDSLR